MKKYIPLQGHTLLPAALLLKRHHGRCPCFLWACRLGPKGKNLRECPRRMASPCQAIAGHIQLNTFPKCQLERGTSAAPSLLSSTCYPCIGARPGLAGTVGLGCSTAPPHPGSRSRVLLLICSSLGGVCAGIDLSCRTLVPGFLPHVKQL